MKALIITEDSIISSKIKAIAEGYGLDTIIYKWFLKALDNIEEIQPDLIILNSSEYPRLWKTLVQFVKSGIGGNDVKIYLYEEKPLSEEDQKKYQTLGITGCFNQITKESLSFLDRGQSKSDLQVTEATSSAALLPEVELPSIGTLLLCETDKGRMLSGKVNKLEENTLICTLDFPSKFETSSISVLTTFINNQIDDYDGAVIKQFDRSKNQLVLEIQ